MPLSNVLGAQSVIKPGVCTSSTRPASPFEGQLIYETDTDLVLAYNGSSWRAVSDTSATNGGILQIVSTTKDDTFSASVATGTNAAITGLSVSITPSDTNSKVLVVANVSGALSTSGGGGHSWYLTLFRGATAIGVAASPGSRQAVTGSANEQTNVFTMTSGGFTYLDSPATTSATTYSVNVSHSSGITRTIYVNRTIDDLNNSSYARSVATITAYEVSA